jgi:diphthine-ammonia ligase
MGGDPTYALMWSGGKDSYLALARARQVGLKVTALVNMYDEATGRVRFHATRHELIDAQAFALGLHLEAYPTSPAGYEATFRQALGQLATAGYHGVVSGDIHLADVRAWSEERVRSAGLEHLEPLWGERPADLLREFLVTGAKAIVTCIELAKLPMSWLGRTLDEGFARDIARRPDVDPCGERGEYHTFVYDGPLFARRVSWRPGAIHKEAGFAQLDLVRR